MLAVQSLDSVYRSLEGDTWGKLRPVDAIFPISVEDYQDAMHLPVLSVLAIVLAPSNFLLLLLTLGAFLLLTRYKSVGWALVAVVTAFLLFVFIFPVDQWLARPLEDRYQRPPLPARLDGILVLGSKENSSQIPVAVQPDSRLVASAVLAKKYPAAKLIFCADPIASEEQNQSEVNMAQAFYTRSGISRSRVIIEDQSQSMREGLVASRKSAGPNSTETWVVVTAAIHMPRAMVIATQLRWHLLPWPVDYLTGSSGNSYESVASRLQRIDLAVREWYMLIVAQRAV